MLILRLPELRAPTLLLAFAAAVCAAHAGDALDMRVEQERARVAAEKQRVESVYEAKLRQCQSQFIVTSCIDDARAERREAMDRLSQQQAVMDDALRKQRAAERLETLQEKREAATRRRETARTQVVERAPSRSAPASSALPRAYAEGASHPRPEAPNAAERERNAAAFQARQRAAAAHRESVERRNAKRAAGHKGAAPLPLPASAPQ